MFYPVYSRNAKTKSFVLKGKDYLDIVSIGTWIMWKEDDTTGVQEVPEELIKALKNEH